MSLLAFLSAFIYCINILNLVRLTIDRIFCVMTRLNCFGYIIYHLIYLFALYGLILASCAMFYNLSYPPTPPRQRTPHPHSPISNFFIFYFFSNRFRQCLANLLFFAEVFLLGEGISVSSSGNDAEIFCSFSLKTFVVTMSVTEWVVIF